MKLIFKKGWTKKEEMFLINIASNDGGIEWQEIAAKLRSLQLNLSTKTPKECQERQVLSLKRWKQITFGIKRPCEWQKNQEHQLLDMYKNVGNKWKLISKSMGGRDLSNIKSHFYALTKKYCRKLSLFIRSHRQVYGHVKQMPESAINKVLALSNKKYLTKIQVSADIEFQLVKETKEQIINYIKNENQWETQEIHQLVQRLMYFNKTCRKKKKAHKNYINQYKRKRIIQREQIKELYLDQEKKRVNKLWDQKIEVFPKSISLEKFKVKNLSYRQQDQDSISQDQQLHSHSELQAEPSNLIQQPIKLQCPPIQQNIIDLKDQKLKEQHFQCSDNQKIIRQDHASYLPNFPHNISIPIAPYFPYYFNPYQTSYNPYYQNYLQFQTVSPLPSIYDSKNLLKKQSENNN